MNKLLVAPLHERDYTSAKIRFIQMSKAYSIFRNENSS